MRKHRKVTVAKVSLVTSGKQISVETIKVPCKPNTASCEAKHALREPKQPPHEPITVPTGIKLAPRQRTNVARETIKAPCEPQIASNKARWIAKSMIAALNSASCEAKTVLDHKTVSAPQLRLSREAKTKALYAYNEATAASLASTTLISSVQPASQ